MSPIRKLTGETALYGLSSVIGRILNYLLVPFYTSIFSPAEYGVITELYAYAAFLQILYTYGIETAYFRFAVQEEGYFYITISTILTSSLLFSSLLVLFATPITGWIAHPGHERYVYYFAAILTVDATLAILFARLRLHKQALRFVSIKLLQISLNVLLNLILLYVFANIYAGHWLNKLQPWVIRLYDPAKNIDYVLMANLVANGAALLLFSQSIAQLKFRLSWHRLRPMLVYAFPLLLMGLAGTVSEMLSRVALRHWLPPDFYPGKSNEAILGIFGACYKLSVFMSLGIQALRYAADPFFFANAKARNAPALFSSVMHYFIIVACFILFAVSVNLELLGYLLLRKAEYREAIATVPYLLLAYLFWGVYYNLSVWFKLTDKTYHGTWIATLGAVITIVLNMMLIPRIGYWGSVWATLASYVTMSGICYYLGQKYYPIPYQHKRGLAYILGTMVGVVLARHVHYTSFGSAVASNLILTLVFGMLLYVLGQRDLRQSLIKK